MFLGCSSIDEKSNLYNYEYSNVLIWRYIRLERKKMRLKKGGWLALDHLTIFLLTLIT